MPFPKRYEYFTNREGRARFISETFQKELAEAATVLDVGSDFNTLKKILGPKVTGVDLYGEPDIRVDLEKERLSRFDDGSYDMVVCTEVLEHLENFHEMVDELTRVSGRYVLVSLPNCLDLFTRLRILFSGDAGKFYGLPFHKPEDRHRWLFSHQEIERFFQRYAKDRALVIERRFLHCNFSESLRGSLVRLLVKTFGLDTAAQSYWILLKK